eukprot:5605560-Amphidinium_carterae.1
MYGNFPDLLCSILQYHHGCYWTTHEQGQPQQQQPEKTIRKRSRIGLIPCWGVHGCGVKMLIKSNTLMIHRTSLLARV